MAVFGLYRSFGVVGVFGCLAGGKKWLCGSCVVVYGVLVYVVYGLLFSVMLCTGFFVVG